tara:strand:- start:5195 stop:5953 length:759 start_codon:yes stop_codon:yes gene_type:complete
MLDTVSDLKDQAGDYLGSDDFKKLMPYLLSGGAAATVGGLLSGRRRKEKDEGRVGYLGRILRNALVAGGLASGSHYLINKGVESTIGSMDTDKMKTGGGEDTGPLATGVKNIAFSPLTAAGAGVAGLAITGRNSLLGDGRVDREKALKALAKRMPLAADQSAAILKNRSAHYIGANVPAALDETRRAAGLASDKLKGAKGTSAWKGRLSHAGRRGLSTFGQTWPRRTVRGGVGLVAAGLPALLGAFLTNKAD